MQQKKIDLSKNYGDWFQNQIFGEYKPPKTVLQTDCIHPIENNQGKDKIKLRELKGFHFQKAKKPNLFAPVNSPGPAFYNLLNTQNTKNVQINVSKNPPIRLKSNSKDKIHSIGVGSYDIDRPQINKSHKQNRFGKAERITYIQQAIFNSSKVPAPGQYAVTIIKRSQSLYLPKSEPKQQKKIQKAKKSASISPWSYQIKRQQSVKCFAIIRNPYREKAENIKSRLDEWKKRKGKACSPEPGKYIKIEQWGKFNKAKQISNGLNTISRPYLRIYN